jgi:hypothetical protein
MTGVGGADPDLLPSLLKAERVTAGPLHPEVSLEALG